MKGLWARLRGLWRREPALVLSVLPALVTAGALTQTQASTITHILSAAGAVVGEIAVAFGIRAKVTPAVKAAPAKPAVPAPPAKP